MYIQQCTLIDEEFVTVEHADRGEADPNHVSSSSQWTSSSFPRNRTLRYLVSYRPLPTSKLMR